MTSLLDTIISQGENPNRTKVHVPEWGVDLYFTSVTGAERARIRKGISPKAVEEIMLSGLQHKATDKDGKLVFRTDQKTRVDLLKHADMTVVMRILTESGLEASPREEMISGATVDQIGGLLTQIGEIDVVAVADLSEDVIEGIRKVILAREPEIADVLGLGPDKSDPGAKLKNG